jgi:hypothetical protein
MANNRNTRATSALEFDTQSQKKVLRIGIVQNGRIVEERLLKKRGNISIGRAADNTFLIPSKDLPRSFKIFEETKISYDLNFVKGMDARLAIDGKVFTLNQVLERGEYVKQVGDYYKLELSGCSRGKLVIGEITILFHFVSPPPEFPKPQLPHVMWGVYALKSWLGNTFMAAVLFSVFIFTPLLILMIHANYDPQYKSPGAKKFVKGIMARHDSQVTKILKEEKLNEEELKKNAAEANDKKNDGKKEENKTADSKSSNDKKNKITDNNVTAKNVDKGIKNIEKDLNKIKDIGKGVGDLSKIKLGDGVKLDNSFAKDIGNFKIGDPSSDSKIGNLGSNVKTLQTDGDCSGDSCTEATNPGFDPSKATGGNDGAFSGGNGNGNGRPGKIRKPGTSFKGIKGLGKLKIGAPNLMLPGMKIKINLMATKIMIGMIKLDPMVNLGMKAKPTASAKASGLIPRGAPTALKKFLSSKKWAIVGCFKRASAKGLIPGSRGKIKVSVRAAGGKINVTGLSGSLASIGYFASCVRSTLNGKNTKAPNFSKSWTFSLHLVGASSN